MKLTLDLDRLAPAAAALSRVTPSRDTIPIVRFAKIEAEGETLRLTATDLDLWETRTLPARVAEPGATTVEAQRLTQLARACAQGAEIAIEADAAGSTIRSGRARWRLPALPVEDFPEVAETEAAHRFTIGGNALSAQLGAVRHAMSREEVRYYLNGVYWHVTDDGQLRAVATDGHRLAWRDLPVPDGADKLPGVILPRRLVDLLAAADDAGPVAVAFYPSANAEIGRVSFEWEGGRTVVSKLIDGTFPDYNRVIPDREDGRVVVDAAELRAALVRMLVTPTLSADFPVALRPEDGTLTLHAKSADGDTEDAIDAHCLDSPPEQIAVNIRYLDEVLGALGADTVAIVLGEPTEPLRLLSTTTDDRGTVLMPLRF